MSAQAQLVEPEISTSIVEFNKFETDLAEYKSRYEGVIYDLTDSDQEKQARSDRLAIGKTIASLDRVHKDVKSPLKAQVDLLDGERKRIKDDLLGVQGSIKDQIAKHEAKHEAKIEAKEQELLGRIEAMKSLAIFEGYSPGSTMIEARISKLTGRVIDASFEHYEAEATFVKVKSLEYLQELLTDVRKQEHDAAELARLQKEQAEREQKERDERIAAEAKEQAEKAAQDEIERQRQATIQAEANAKAAAEKAQADRLAAIKQAEESQARAILEVEEKARREAEALKKANREARAAEDAKQEKREANKRHCAKINNAAVAELCSVTGINDPAIAKEVVKAIAKGLIPAVSIRY